jgi:hypothetical protein
MRVPRWAVDPTLAYQRVEIEAGKNITLIRDVDALTGTGTKTRADDPSKQGVEVYRWVHSCANDSKHERTVNGFTIELNRPPLKASFSVESGHGYTEKTNPIRNIFPTMQESLQALELAVCTCTKACPPQRGAP